MADPVADTTNSFATLAEANTYFLNQYNRYALWAVITDADKSRLLIEATVMMTWGLSWNITIDEDDYSESYDVQKWACCEQAWAIYVGDRQSAPDTKGISEIKVDVIEIVFDKTDRVGMFSRSALNYIRAYITYTPGGLNVPVVRA